MPLTSATPAITEALKRLDTMEQEVTQWEAGFLESVMRFGCKSPKQRQVLARRVERYLDDTTLASEVLGQERLL